MKKLTAIVNGKEIKGFEYDRTEDGKFIWIETEEDIYKVKATDIVGTKKELIERIRVAIEGVEYKEFIKGAEKAGLSNHYAYCLHMYVDRFRDNLERNYSKKVIWNVLKAVEVA